MKKILIKKAGATEYSVVAMNKYLGSLKSIDEVNDIMIIDGEQYNPSTGFPADGLTFRAMMSQTGTDAPRCVNIAGDDSNPYQDEIGGVWSYNDVGTFRYTKAGAFADVDKIAVTISDNRANMTAKPAVSITKLTDNILQMVVGELGAFASTTTFTPANGLLYKQDIKIELLF